MSTARVVFFGTPDFASATLTEISLTPGIQVVAVVTAPDKQAGR